MVPQHSALTGGLMGAFFLSFRCSSISSGQDRIIDTLAPRHSTSEMVNILSLVISPGPIPMLAFTASMISSEPLNQQGVVLHTWI